MINLQGNVFTTAREENPKSDLRIGNTNRNPFLDSQATMTLTISSMSISCVESISNRKSSSE